MDSVDDQKKGGQTTIVERAIRMKQGCISYELPFNGICLISGKPRSIQCRDRRTMSDSNGYDAPLVAALCSGSVKQGQASKGGVKHRSQYTG